MAKKGIKQKRYDTALKIAAVKTYLNTELSYQSVCGLYEICDKSTLIDWVRKYKAYGEGFFEVDSSRKGLKYSVSKERKLKKENEYLRLENEYLKKAAEKIPGMSDLRVKFLVIKESTVQLSIVERCRCLKVNRSSYYKSLNRQLSKRARGDEYLKKLILQCYHDSKGTYGKKRIHYWLRNVQDIKINHKRTERLIRELGIKAVIRKKWRTRKYIKQNIAPNMLNREFYCASPNSRYVIDVTELPLLNGKKYYLCPVKDLFNAEIVSYSISTRNDNELVLSAIEKICPAEPDKKIILHSDQGCQFTSNAYKELLDQKGIMISHSRVGDCYDNASAESFFSHFKEEFYIFYRPSTQEELYKDIDRFIYYYNQIRIHSRLKTSPKKYRDRR